jgi:hypothetical protein
MAEPSAPAPATQSSASALVASDATDRAQARSEAAADRFGIEPSPARGLVERAINPGDYECGPTDLDAYVDGLIGEMSTQDLIMLITTPALDIPTYDALLFGTKGNPEYALRGDYAQVLSNTFRDAQRFWDVETSDIQLMAMHGTVLQDQARSARVMELVFGFTPAQAQAQAKLIADTLATSTALDGGNNPLFTLNAYAFTAEGDPDPLVAGVPDKLVFGDGILDALDAMGLPNVGPRAVMGHEFGHHVQFEDNLFDSPLTGPEATRRTELMADAFGTYFATHARGLSLNDKRVLQAEKSFFEVGDCAFTNPGHHGTPNQRLRASTWAADLANAARPQGKILPSLTLAAVFERKLPEFVAPDKP